MPVIRSDEMLREDGPPDSPCGSNRVHRISEVGGLTQFGAFIEELPPSSRSGIAPRTSSSMFSRVLSRCSRVMLRRFLRPSERAAELVPQHGAWLLPLPAWSPNSSNRDGRLNPRHRSKRTARGDAAMASFGIAASACSFGAALALPTSKSADSAAVTIAKRIEYILLPAW
jgi:hypothetical protein